MHTVQKRKSTLINVDDKVGCARACAEIGAQIVGVHTGLDAQAAGHTPFADLADISRLRPCQFAYQLLVVSNNLPYKTLFALALASSLLVQRFMVRLLLQKQRKKFAIWLMQLNLEENINASETYRRQNIKHSRLRRIVRTMLSLTAKCLIMQGGYLSLVQGVLKLVGNFFAMRLSAWWLRCERRWRDCNAKH